MNKMGVGMTWLRSLPNFQHHPNLAYYATTQCLPRRLSKKTRPHRRNRLAPPSLPPIQEKGHFPFSGFSIFTAPYVCDLGQPFFPKCV